MKLSITILILTFEKQSLIYIYSLIKEKLKDIEEFNELWLNTVQKSGNSAHSHSMSLYKCHALSQNQLTKKLHRFLGDIYIYIFLYTATE